MKLQVGKTYVDGYGKSFYIECQINRHLSRARPAGTFFGTSSKGFEFFKEDGTVALEGTYAKNALLPNTVKKKGWIVRYGSSVAPIIMVSEEKARAAYPNAASYHEIEWEEEEA